MPIDKKSSGFTIYLSFKSKTVKSAFSPTWILLPILNLSFAFIDNNSMSFSREIIFGITMLIIGYNNKVVYNRPKFAWVYYITGAILIICDILMIIGV